MTEICQKILLLGAAGQVGRCLAKTLQPLGKVTAISRADVDLADKSAVEQLLERLQPHIVVNAAAYTAVDDCENHTKRAAALNSLLPAQLARYAYVNKALLVDFSTDYVFDGKKTEPWCETDKAKPLSIYGETKRNGLLCIERSGCDYLVFRVSWVYADEGKNFPNTIKALATTKTALTVVDDQRGTPTPARWIADVSAHCIEQVMSDTSKLGTYNLAPQGSTTWFGFAREVVAKAKDQGIETRLNVDDIRPVNSDAYPTAATRPANSVLDTAKLQKTFAILPPHWQTLYWQA